MAGTLTTGVQFCKSLCSVRCPNTGGVISGGSTAHYRFTLALNLLVLRGFINVFNRKAINFHRQAGTGRQ